MSEKVPSQYPLSPAELASLNAKDQIKIEEATRKLNELAQAEGYISVKTFEELNLTPEQIEQLMFFSKTRRKHTEKYYQANRKDGTKAKIITLPRPDGCYFAEFFSPNNHGGNHDFSLHEMQENMKQSLE